VEPIVAPAVVEPSLTTQVAMFPEAAEPAVTAAPKATVAAAPAPAPVDREALKSTLESSGLVWIETAKDKVQPAVVAEPEAPVATPTRARRARRPAPPAEPLQQVETDSGDKPA
jgi:hypothetical protein